MIISGFSLVLSGSSLLFSVVSGGVLFDGESSIYGVMVRRGFNLVLSGFILVFCGFRWSPM